MVLVFDGGGFGGWRCLEERVGILLACQGMYEIRIYLGFKGIGARLREKELYAKSAKTLARPSWPR